MFDAIERFDDYLISCFGESGAEAFHDAVLHYVSTKDSFPGGQDDLFVLLCYLRFSRFTDSLYDSFNPFMNMSIKIDVPVKSPLGGENK